MARTAMTIACVAPDMPSRSVSYIPSGRISTSSSRYNPSNAAGSSVYIVRPSAPVVYASSQYGLLSEPAHMYTSVLRLGLLRAMSPMDVTDAGMISVVMPSNIIE